MTVFTIQFEQYISLDSLLYKKSIYFKKVCCQNKTAQGFSAIYSIFWQSQVACKNYFKR